MELWAQAPQKPNHDGSDEHLIALQEEHCVLSCSAL